MRLWNSLFPGLMAHAFNELVVVDHPADAADHHSQRPKIASLRAGTLAHVTTSSTMRACITQWDRLHPLGRTSSFTTLITSLSGNINMTSGAFDTSHRRCQEMSEATSGCKRRTE
jgi:hypothetical protein